MQAESEKRKASAPHSEEEDEVLAQQAANIFSLLLKGLKNISIYRHAESRFAEYLDPAFKALSAFLAAEKVLPLKLGPFTLEFKKHVIYEEQSKENLTYKFYRDGMRFLLFRDGLSVEELLRFVLLSIENTSDAALFQEDMITRLWKEHFQSIEYVVVEGFGFGDMSEDEVEMEVDKVVGYLRKQLAAHGDDITRFARLGIEDLALELADIDQVRGGIISGRPASNDDKTWVQSEIYTEEKKRLFAKMVLILFQILERDANKEDFEMMTEAFSQVLDTLILSEDVRGSVAVLTRFDQFGIRDDIAQGHRDLVGLIRENFARKMAEPQRLQAVGQYVLLAKNLDEMAVKAYLSVLSEEQIPFLMEMIETMERVEGRRILIDVLAEVGKHQANIFIQRLDSKSSNMVKDMLAVIEKIDPPNKLEAYAKCLEHPNIMIRLEGLKVIAKSTGDQAASYLEKAIGDEDIQMRLQAYRGLAMRSPGRALPVLKKLMKAEDFGGKDQREQMAITIALAEVKSDEVLEFFSSILETKGGLFNRGKSNELKQWAIKGLEKVHNAKAFKILAREVQNKGQSKEIVEACHKAAQKLKAELSGGGSPPPSS